MDEIGKYISILYRQLQLFLNHELEESGITATELMYLGSLYRKDDITQDDLVREYCIDKAATARTIQGMEKKGLVTRRPSASDKRAKCVCLTPKANGYYDLIEQIQKKWLRQINVDLTRDEMECFVRVLAVVAEKAKKINEGQEDEGK